MTVVRIRFGSGTGLLEFLKLFISLLKKITLVQLEQDFVKLKVALCATVEMY